MKNVLITGGAGYIGAHFVKLLRDKSDYSIHILDNFSQSRKNILNHPRINYHEIDIRNKEQVELLFKTIKFDSVLHFAALASVPDSVINPANYYEHNVVGSLNILEAMRQSGCLKIVFSSSASVYGEPTTEEIAETHPKNPTNPYGQTKLIVERMLSDYHTAYGINSISFRYFCAAGSDPALEVGEFHTPETHVIPAIIETILGIRDEFFVYGNDFNTHDGTGIRDYIHVVDLAEAHLLALLALDGAVMCECYNLGINKGFSVLELIQTAEEVTGFKVPYKFKSRRTGDPSRLIALSDKAQKELKWTPTKTDIKEIVESTYNFFKTKK